MKRVALVGHCGPDMSRLMLTIRKAAPDAQIERVNSQADLERFAAAGAGLLLVNRMLDGWFDDENGIELIRRIRASRTELRAMLVSNYPDAQQSAVSAGALDGFGKNDAGSQRVLDLLRSALVGLTPPQEPARRRRGEG